MFWFFYKNESKVDSHIAKPTVDMFQIFNINLIELGGTFLYRAPAFNMKIQVAGEEEFTRGTY